MSNRTNHVLSSSVMAVGVLCVIATGRAQDCNNNGVSDAVDLLPDRLGFLDPIASEAEVGVITVKSRDYMGNPIDLNADRRPDLIVANRESNTISILLNNGDATFSAVGHYPVEAFPQSLAVGDFNRDELLDIAVACTGHPGMEDGRSVDVIYGLGEGAFSKTVSYPVEYRAKSIVAGDFNDDGYVDLAVARWNGPVSERILVMLNRRDGSFRLGGAFYAGVGGAPTEITAGDVTGDGVVDLVALIFGPEPFSEIVVLPGVGDGTFPYHIEHPIGHPWWQIAPSGVVLADLDGDDDLDIAVSNWYYEVTGWGDLRLLENLGDGTFGDFIISAPLGPNIETITATDLDFDGDMDLVLAIGSHCCSEAVVMLNQGFMNFRGPYYFPTGNWTRSIDWGDFDNDGRIDFVTANVDNDDNISVLLGTTDGPAFDHDCNLNDIPDGCDISDGTSEDCNDNGFPDECEFDCNENGVPDECDIARRDSRDGNRNGVPDECEACYGDFNRNGVRDEIDLQVLRAVMGCAVDPQNWPCHEADIDGDGQVNPVDLGLLQALLGPCPD